MKERLNLHINAAKRQFIYFDSIADVDALDLMFPFARDNLRSLGIPIRLNVASLLGSFVYRDDQCLGDHLRTSVMPFTRLRNALPVMKHERMPTQYAMLMLRYCLVPKLSYLIRTIRPSALEPVCQTFDNLIMDTAFDLLTLNDVPASSMPKSMMRDQLQLRCRMGGFGLTSSK